MSEKFHDVKFPVENPDGSISYESDTRKIAEGVLKQRLFPFGEQVLYEYATSIKQALDSHERACRKDEREKALRDFQKEGCPHKCIDRNCPFHRKILALIGKNEYEKGLDTGFEGGREVGLREAADTIHTWLCSSCGNGSLEYIRDGILALIGKEKP